ncbi:hypothetical protein ElyMa_003915100, partial [Elysia marginata]
MAWSGIEPPDLESDALTTLLRCPYGNGPNLLFTTFHASGGGSRSRIHASTFYLDAEQAQIACKRRGMQLVEISTRHMFNSISTSLGNINPHNGQAFLIAGRYENGKYMLENGHDLPSNLPWHQGEPS